MSFLPYPPSNQRKLFPIIDQAVADLPSPFGQTPPSDRNRLRFGACTEYNADTVQEFVSCCIY